MTGLPAAEGGPAFPPPLASLNSKGVSSSLSHSQGIWKAIGKSYYLRRASQVAQG